jgi:hypothetical protein
MKLALTLLLLIGSQAEAASLKTTTLPESLQKLDRECASIDGGDAYACPIYRAYKVQGNADLTRASEVIRLFAAMPDGSEYSLRSDTAKKAAALITSRLAQQTEDLKNLDAAPGSYTSARKVLSGLSNYVAGWKQQVFSDDDTYWAPSVNSATVILVNPKDKIILEIQHGDTDG